MKRFIRILPLVFLLVFPLPAQNIINIFANLGYGFGMGGHFVGSSNTYFGEADRLETKDHFLNLGHGFKLEAGSGIMLLPFLEGRVSFDLTLGAPSPKINSVRSNDIIQDTLINYSYSSRGLRAIVAPHFEVLELFDMYVGVGLVFNTARSEKDIIITISEPQIQRTAKIVSEIPFALGFTGVAGLEIPVADNITFIGELRFEQMNHKLKREQVDSVFNFPEIRTVSYEQDDVERNPPPNIPGTNWGLRFGLRIWLL